MTKLKKGYTAKDTKEIQRIIRTYFKNLYSTKLKNLKEMDNFLDIYNLPNKNKSKSDEHTPILFSEIEAVIKPHNERKKGKKDGRKGGRKKRGREGKTQCQMVLVQKSMRLSNES